ncbi:hypothetical protein TSOC_005391 [Tetrabaena socialis]|uniref:Uncharacterized protein n=1 Tax=Tetrabaena socialis TaxID=47790 RepID=A0A2J8A6C5_9CHLO|nr:hypothetical protein TSOC_005391 [Tetrabaena socialis]|eukprot:PNH08081.1 hypothetical protein TSOC_005391 [Tetrabaena socialis]
MVVGQAGGPAGAAAHILRDKEDALVAASLSADSRRCSRCPAAALTARRPRASADCIATAPPNAGPADPASLRLGNRRRSDQAAASPSAASVCSPLHTNGDRCSASGDSAAAAAAAASRAAGDMGDMGAVEGESQGSGRGGPRAACAAAGEAAGEGAGGWGWRSSSSGGEVARHDALYGDDGPAGAEPTFTLLPLAPKAPPRLTAVRLDRRAATVTPPTAAAAAATAPAVMAAAAPTMDPPAGDPEAGADDAEDLKGQGQAAGGRPCPAAAAAAGQPCSGGVMAGPGSGGSGGGTVAAAHGPSAVLRGGSCAESRSSSVELSTGEAAGPDCGGGLSRLL